MALVMNNQVYLADGGGSTKKSTSVWKSYEEAAAAGYSNIRTMYEFDRGGSDKKKYGTYEAYLEGMYNKYVGENATGSAQGGYAQQTVQQTTPAPTVNTTSPAPSTPTPAPAPVPQTQPVQTPAVDTSYAANTAPSTQPTQPAQQDPTPTQTPSPSAEQSAGTAPEGIDTYEEYLRRNESTFEDIYNEQTRYYDEQNRQTLEAIEKQRQEALAEAENQKKMLYDAAETSKNNAYSYADALLAADLGYSKEQYETLIASIIANKESGMALAESQKQALLSMSEEQRNAIYEQAESKRADKIAHAQAQYSELIKAINAQKETGEALAKEQRDLLLSMSEDMRNKVYEAAEIQRQNTYANADVERERGVVDARSSYEQNKATYGANAEAMAGMGLTGSGYGDYINSQAYAQQRAETQVANAQAAAVKRDADYVESKAKLDADTDHIQNKYNADAQYSQNMHDLDLSYQNNKFSADQRLADAEYEAKQEESASKAQADAAHRDNTYKAESEYADRKYEIDTTYANNMASADAQKKQMDYEANSKAESAKYEADQAYNENKYAADTSYSKNIFEANSSADAEKLKSEQAAESGKNGAYLSYQENLLKNNDKIAAYSQQKADEEKAKQEEETSYARAAFTEFMQGANNGTYTVDQLRQLSREYGLNEEQTQSLVSAANEYNRKKQASVDLQISSDTGDTAGVIGGYVDSGVISAEQGQEKTYNVYKDEVAYGTADTGSIDSAYKSGRISEAQYKDLQKRWNDNIETTADFFYSNGTMLNQSAAKQALDNLTKSAWCSSATKASLNAIYKSLYSPITKGVTFNNDGGWWIFGSTDTGAAGNNFSVIHNGTKYRVEYGGEISDTNIKEIASGVANEQVFGYQEKIYIKQNGKVYLVQERENSYGDHYDSLYNIFFGNGDATSVKSANDAGSAAKAGTGSSSTTVTYPSDSEIANKAANGTLTYHDVAKYNAGIRTQSEFGRGNNADKQKYGTYQAYLKAMYEKYKK